MLIIVACSPPKMLTHLYLCLSLNFPYAFHILPIMTRHIEGAESSVLSKQVSEACSE